MRIILKVGRAAKHTDILVIFVKYPVPGTVKTRLAKSIGKKNAACLYRLFVETIIRRTSSRKYRRIVFYTPTERKEDFREWLGNIEFFPQKGKDLGERMASTFKLLFKNGARRVVIIGTDSPLIKRCVINKAFALLKKRQCVIGPSFDGGYYLLGLSSFCSNIFQNIEWGSCRVFKQTLDRIHSSRLTYSLLKSNFDVDDIDDLLLFKRRAKDLSKKEFKYISPVLDCINNIF